MSQTPKREPTPPSHLATIDSTPRPKMVASPSPSPLSDVQIQNTRAVVTTGNTATVASSQGHEDIKTTKGTVTRGEEVTGKASAQDVLQTAKQSKINQLTARNEALTAEISRTTDRLQAVTRELRSEQPAHETVRRHITLLHRYNELRDIGQALLGLVADNRGVRIRDVYGDGDEFGVREGD